MAQNNVSNNQTNSQMSDELMRDVSALYRASRRGDVQALEYLLQQNASILDSIPDDGCETPLHISALLNHAPFTQVLLNHNGDLATRKDASGRTALHLASAEDNLEAVQRLLEFNDEPCLVADRKGRLPLHYAAMRGRTEVAEALVIARPDSLGCLDPGRNSVFHLCVMYNHFKTLRVLVKLDYATANVTVGAPRAPIFTLPDHMGNTILHLAVIIGDTTNFVEEIRGNVRAASVFIATVSFQALINPPGGLIQQGLLSRGNTSNSSSSGALNCTTLNDLHQYCPGQAVSSFRDQKRFWVYVEDITLSFYGSICVTLLLVSGVPLQNSAVVWIPSFGMLFTLFFLAFPYLTALDFMIPDHLLTSELHVVTPCAFALTFMMYFILMLLVPCIRALSLKTAQIMRRLSRI
ncbi:serine/threonine-protein phosphatase 6 regulatory ankyrin repeat subunit A-like [Neltuma alba]|uniref:serine/threonine-protein phosphatase 6 regulatory ankyrin repeat subunit A-like n=1 Tax=Neltuma alba TaxID=207710 RepID=UPI0010A3ACBF|nr:serine/threonine-protein phosphatase 6 regulatory ankyrin repeat subunit A-like [Prosopis alba]